MHHKYDIIDYLEHLKQFEQTKKENHLVWTPCRECPVLRNTSHFFAGDRKYKGNLCWWFAIEKPIFFFS